MSARRPLDVAAYQHASQTQPCFICEVIDGTDAAHHVVYRDEISIAFLNRYPSLYGYVLVCPIEHRSGVVEDFSLDEYLALQAVVHRIGRAVSAAVPTERLYLLSLGSNQGNQHVHWHVAPLPPGVEYEQQQYGSLMLETSGGYLELSDEEAAELGAKIRNELESEDA